MASLLDLDRYGSTLLGLPGMDVQPPDDRQASQADALAQTWQGVMEAMARQRAVSAERGLWNDETGLPTQAGVADAVQQASMNLLLSTSAPGFKMYHGSPHDFPPTPRNPLGEFDLSKIGTGEGNQAYGHGHYLAEREGVARGYRDNLTVKPITPELKAAQDAYNKAYWDVPTGGTQAEFDAAIARRDAAQAEMRRVQTEWEAQPAPKGHMYEVNVKADPEHFLHWDKPLSEQSQHVQDVLAGRGPAPEGPGGKYVADYVRSWAERQQPGRYDVSEGTARLLKEAGIPGIRYLDQGSRHAPKLSDADRQQLQAAIADKQRLIADPRQQRDIAMHQADIDLFQRRLSEADNVSHNAVVFDDAMIEILRKYGLAGLILGGSGAAAAGSQQPQQQ